MAARNQARDKRNFERMLKEARIGTLEAQYELALMYANGLGVPADISKAIHWLQQAATRGLSSAQYLLATRYLGGIGVERDEQLALQWLSKAAGQGNAKAMLRLGRFLDVAHHDAAMLCMRKASQLGLAEAQYAWARAAMAAAPGTVDMAEVLHWLGEAARQEFAPAQTALADLYATGLGVATDLERALDGYRKAAAQGHLAAIVALERLDQAGKARNSTGPKNTRRARTQERRRSADHWIASAEQGDTDTRYHLGLMFEMGWGVDQNEELAQHWYRVAAQQGDMRAQLALGKSLERSGQREALDWYQRAALQGDTDAQFALARNLFSGNLSPPDRLQGLAWYLRSAEQGHAAALVTAGSLLSGELSDVALACFERAALRGVAEAQFKLGENLLGSAKEPEAARKALEWVTLAAQQGHAAAQRTLGLMYLRGTGTARDAHTAAQWLLKAAQQDDAKAQWNLGSMYASGNEALARDIPQSLHWCHKAAEQGFAAAQATLGAIYAKLERWSAAQHWLMLAVAQDDPEALFNLAVLAIGGNMQGISPQQALTYLFRSADHGVVAAQSRLGIAFAKGEGAALDPIEAHKWFLIASRQGDGAATSNLQYSEKLMADAPMKEAVRRADAWFERRLA